MIYFQSWRRLSSLQRLIIIFLLLVTILIAFYVLPSQLSNEMDRSAQEHLEKHHKVQNLPLEPGPLKDIDVDTGNDKLDEMRRKVGD